VFSFSIKPLRMFSILGLGILALTGILTVVSLVMSLLTNPPAGITTVLVLLLANLGVTSLGIGVLGEYIAKIYAESKRRPLWLVDYTLNMDAPAASGSTGLPSGSPSFPGQAMTVAGQSPRSSEAA